MSWCCGFRELSLQTADEDEGGQERPSKKKKKKNESELAESGRVNDAEHWVMKRQKQKARKEEEAKKSKRTVFVGNLPISCTKKVCTGNNKVSTQGLCEGHQEMCRVPSEVKLHIHKINSTILACTKIKFC